MKKSSTDCFAVLFAAWMVACGGLAEETPEPSSVGSKDLAASPVARLAKAIEDGDAETVATFVCYPLKRKSPLPPIENEEQFTAYFPVLFDKAFRQEMRGGGFSRDWEELGCRGVMSDNGALWMEDASLENGGKITDVNYHSVGEKKTPRGTHRRRARNTTSRLRPALRPRLLFRDGRPGNCRPGGSRGEQ